MFKCPKPSANQVCLIIVLVFIAVIATLNSCTNTPPTIEAQMAEGKELAKKYCIACHQLPDPALIDRKSWEDGVLPAMAKNLGIKSLMGQYYPGNGAAMSISDWQKIVLYYKNTAPVALIIPKPAVEPLKDWAIFSLQRPKIVNQAVKAMTTMVTFNPVNHQLYTGDAANNLYKWDADLNSTLVHHFDSPITGADFYKAPDGSNTAIITCIGDLPPTNLYRGTIYQLNLDAQNSKPDTIAGKLPRPVQTVAADFNKDGLMDYVVCGFGHDSGGLYLLQQQAGHKFKKTTIRDVPGGEQLITGDFNNDGWPDVMCLFAQADEGIWMFLNDHKGGFITQNIMHFPAVYGSASFQLVDFNHDGRPDILYTCGDNSDFSQVLKPYHGVYIFTNQGNWKFKQTYFYHIDGCTKAIADDFAHDGKFGIAAIAFFTDFKYHPQESFTYLQQTGLNQYRVHEIPVDNYGRWLNMEVGDIDHNGYDDVILGNFSIGGRGLLNQKDFTPQWDKHEPVIVLKNIAGQKHK
jgi:hypothetical protein